MTMNEYQAKALETDISPKDSTAAIAVSLFGLAGEVGELLSVYKRNLWTGDMKISRDRVSEELGDLLWYLASTAGMFGLTLNEVASNNIRKCHDNWHWLNQQKETQMSLPIGLSLDEAFPECERLPRQMFAQICDLRDGKWPAIELKINGKKTGNNLTDNSYHTDGYRFHDVFHLSYAAVLGWSPVIRSNLKCKRKSIPLVDEVEDGGRAIVVEEGIAAMLFSYASQRSFLQNVTRIDAETLRTIKGMTAGLEVARCTTADWEKAILMGYAVWREIERDGGGTILVDLDKKIIQSQPTLMSTE